METAKSVAAALRQLVCMEATVDYLIANSHMFSDSIDKKAFQNTIKSVCDKLVKLKGTTRALHRRAKYVIHFILCGNVFTVVCLFFSGII